MHSAASSISLWLPVVLNLSPEQEAEARHVDYAVSYARTIAGVHYTTDNIAGLALGQEIIAQKLPTLLNNWYGSDIGNVMKKIASKRFSWTSYHNSVGGIQLPSLIIKHFNSGRRIYARSEREGFLGVGATYFGAVYDDQRWDFKQVSCPNSTATDCYYIINSHSKRSLFEITDVNPFAKIGAGNPKFFNDRGKWKLIEFQVKGRKIFIIQNAVSGGRIFAHKNKRFGLTDPNGPIHPDQYWFVDGGEIDIPPLIIKHLHSGSRLYAQHNKNASERPGGTTGRVYNNQRWKFKPVSCDGSSTYDCYYIINYFSKGGLYEISMHSRLVEVKAPSEYNDNEKWKLIEHQIEGQQAFSITNVASGNRLFAQKGKTGHYEIGAAFPDGEIATNQYWSIIGL
uniref:Ricin B lectin domain-containing protein n=1 Tax=Corethron hystrix TaxID=216773 RepID=A0A6U5LYN7_9STRA|mmetsp:Transcript_7627/g.16548  ORF Transcript_7627/g.16548 Transcript_7627/m.16548 type:complete len:397 (+) Transcript_7627:241-1431(+)